MSVSNHVDQPRISGNVIPARDVQMFQAPLPGPAEARPQLLNAHQVSCSAEPRISVIKEGGIVRAIEVVCTCGEVIRLECEY